MCKFVTPDQVQVGTILISDDEFTCLKGGERLTVQKDEEGLFVPCAMGEHYLEEEDGAYIGFTLATETDQ